MALNFFKQRDIDEMDVNDIPEEFINFLETLDEAGKIGLLASRPDFCYGFFNCMYSTFYLSKRWHCKL